MGNLFGLTKYNAEKLSTQDLKKILEEISAVKSGGLCTVQIKRHWNGETTLYGVWGNPHEWVENYHNSGGVWSYHRPEHYIKIVENEFKRRGLFATNVRILREA